MGGVHVTYVANIDKGQQHVETLVWCIKNINSFSKKTKEKPQASF